MLSPRILQSVRSLSLTKKLKNAAVLMNDCCSLANLYNCQDYYDAEVNCKFPPTQAADRFELSQLKP